MTIAAALAVKIASLYLMAVLGWIVVKTGVMKASDSRVLSMAILYIMAPCAIINAFQVDYTKEIVFGFFVSLGMALIMHVILLGGSALLAKTAHLDAIEELSIGYTNSLTMVMPLVLATYGQEGVIYCMPFFMVQTVLIWSHGKTVMSGQKDFSLREILNCNIVAAAAGIAMFFLRIRLPGVVLEMTDAVSGTMTPVSMIMLGMIVAGMDVRHILGRSRLWIVTILRLAVFPLIILGLVKLSHLEFLIPNGREIVMISLFGCMTPTANTITSFAQIYDRDSEYACAINIAGTTLCMVTIPLLTLLL